jgi:hypothetical protein
MGRTLAKQIREASGGFHRKDSVVELTGYRGFRSAIGNRFLPWHLLARVSMEHRSGAWSVLVDDLTGARGYPLRRRVTMAGPTTGDRLYLKHDSGYSAVELLPCLRVVRLDSGDVGCFFFSSIDKEQGMRWVSYNFAAGRSEEYKHEPGIRELQAFLSRIRR